MTTTVPKIYSFEEFAGVADAVADHVINAQNQALSSISPNNNSSTSSSSSSRKGSQVQSELNISNISNKSNTESIETLNSSSQLSSTKSSSNISKSSSKKEKIVNKRFKIAISGGSLISVLSQGLLKRDDVQWDKWDIFFADERLVPFSEKDSNYGIAKAEIFDKLAAQGKPSPKVYHIDESLINDAQEAADEYEKTLIKNFANKDSVRLPLFDLFLLGCAPDGHIASIFPNDHEVLREKLAWVVPVENAPSGPSRRITLTIPVICHSHRVSFVVEGAVKASIVQLIMERPEKGLPASVVNALAAGRVSWFVDKAALSECY
ncbi:hypothetical protein WICMUC_005631 [Wickerhamomyces mucosus]|uniref:6-phosphogluconolactonase-like protein n=1 Tax=Wickerhamomyces mucosus TaxID=1378264 RepID=A0A9P8P767_9ASCO|nr:hypothetical protein WICMUC_005631 [Wickerhamomyces mucosus]